MESQMNKEDRMKKKMQEHEQRKKARVEKLH